MCEPPDGADARSSNSDDSGDDTAQDAASSGDVWQLIGASASDSIVASSTGRNAAAFSIDVEPQQNVEMQDLLEDLRNNVEQDSLYSHSHAVSEAEPIHVDPNRNLEYAWNSLYPSASAPFWETGFWSQIFGTGVGHFGHFDMLEMNRPAAVSCDPAEEPCEETTDVMVQPAKKRAVTSYHQVIKNTTVQSWQDEREALWQKAIRRWHALVLAWKQDVNIVQLLVKETGFSKQAQILVDIFYNKSPSTLLKRANSLGRVVNHLALRQELFPCDEPALYEYLVAQRHEGAPATRLKAVLEACRFARHVLGVQELDECIASRRCAGAVSLPLGKELHQATPLTVEHLKTIHQVLHSDSDPWDKCFAGMVLFCVYARARWSDAQHSEKVIGDRDEKGELFFIECSTAVHKTARALQMRHMFLPLVAPTRGVEAECWGEPWLAARNILGIEDLRRFPLMPAPDASGDATIRPVSTSEASSWLEHLLTKTHGKLQGKRYTSHSLKATMLSYLAKRGVPFEDRLALGYHANPLRMALTYSRDGASRPLAVLCDMLAEIRKGVFSPDVTRSGRLQMGSDKEAAASEVADVTLVPDDVVVIKDEDETAVSETSDHVTTDSESDTEEPVFLPKVQRIDHVLPKESVMWQHSRLKTLHVAVEGHKRAFFCGRPITEGYQLVSLQHRFDTPRCRQCFNSKLMLEDK